MKRPLILVTAIVCVVLVLGAGGVALANSGGGTPVATAVVARSDLQATVTASGNVRSGITSELSLHGAGGIVTRVYVEPGDEVETGDRLVAVDDTAARQQQRTAEAGLAAAQAALITAEQGRSDAERGADDAAIAAAEQSLKNAENGVDAAEATYQLVTQQQADLVEAAAQAQDDASAALAQDQAELDRLQAELAATDPADSATVSRLTTSIAEVQAQLAADTATLGAASSALAQAQRTQDSAVLEAKNALSAQRGVRDSAKKALEQQRATVAVAEQGARPGTLDAARAQVESAQVAVDQARTAVDNTILRAPFAGVVSDVTAVVGQTAAAGAGTAGGLVTLVDPAGKSIGANVSEADAVSLEVGQTVDISFPANGLTASGTVASIDPRSSVVDNVVQYQTTIAIGSGAEEARIGQTADVTITTRTATGVLVVPTSAVITADGRTWVLRMEAENQTRVEVTTGLVGTSGTEIRSGLRAGDRVVLTAGTQATPSATATGSR
ncbi:MAG: hypothetical protein CVT65_17045 [Actinobacteria bacterium HGW-Actinobacteria-5]|jgi:multidrug efflux pump subunit AcrA (membrane-fusion protein)|nr:MAG: hypothetical protein CVT65_17045 [Actinobacteria bacterium HGW-Actinobacteria-5]